MAPACSQICVAGNDCCFTSLFVLATFAPHQGVVTPDSRLSTSPYIQPIQCAATASSCPLHRDRQRPRRSSHPVHLLRFINSPPLFPLLILQHPHRGVYTQGHTTKSCQNSQASRCHHGICWSSPNPFLILSSCYCSLGTHCTCCTPGK